MQYYTIIHSFIETYNQTTNSARLDLHFRLESIFTMQRLLQCLFII